MLLKIMIYVDYKKFNLYFFLMLINNIDQFKLFNIFLMDKDKNYVYRKIRNVLKWFIFGEYMYKKIKIKRLDNILIRL